ncbi:MAG: flagellar type III secretion system protein FlhB [Sterolibacteriaceae bacterium]|uniref:Flagellar biosynthetic protein FlhB n=1 Tax=Candidatus Methylophosphatis roskildensis TaxID=2899263 RepID=A0A9D7HQN0_9PROT|nr:flagellar type III secretion system protein FlhB [Candidatus Methylophosphatis roskildensis]
MAEGSDLEKTEAPSGKRISEARGEGQVPHSKELSTFLVLIAGVGGMWVFGQWIAQHTQGMLRDGLYVERRAAFDPHAMLTALFDAAVAAMIACAPLLALTIFAALAGRFAIGGWNFTTKPLAPNFGKLDPLRGFKRMFSADSLVELVKAVLKTLLVGGIAFWAIRHERDAIFALASTPLEVGLSGIARLLLIATMLILLGLALLSALDVPWQLWRYTEQLKMSRQELKQESKDAEGNPEIKARIRGAQRAMARKRMMAEVPTADVVVTNPTHYAVALKYDADAMGAPRVVAKGMNLIAQNIRELAAANSVPLLEAPPLARALYRHTEIGASIPAALYTAVAEVMAWVYQLNHFIAQGGLPPEQPADLPVPPELDPGPGPD